MSERTDQEIRIKYTCRGQDCGFTWYVNPGWPDNTVLLDNPRCTQCDGDAVTKEEIVATICVYCGRRAEDCDNETFEMSCVVYNRAEALSRLLGVDVSRLENLDYGLYDEGMTFAVDARYEKFGTSPEEAKRLTAQLRESLRKVYGNVVNEWNTNFFIANHVLWSNVNDSLKRAKKDLEKLRNDRWLKVAERAFQNVRTGVFHKPFDIGNEKHRKDARLGIAERDRHAFDMFCTKYASTLSNIDGLEQQLKKIVVYSTVESELKKVCPEDLKKGIHEVLNTLYTVTQLPRVEGTSVTARVIRDAFDGKELKDERVPRYTNSGEYAVLTGDEADTAWDASLDSYIDECMEIPDHVMPYFDRDGWKTKARIDGRGHALSSYDGTELVVEAYNGDTLYVYRVN